MLFDVDLTQKEVNPPHDRWCCSGHEAVPFFKRNGPNSKDEPTRFFLVTGSGINGIYCELCLIVAHHMAKNR
jgi:hypothetical protein